MIDTNHIEQRARELLAAECDRTVEGMRYDAHGVVSLNVALSAIRRALSARASAGEGGELPPLPQSFHNATNQPDRQLWPREKMIEYARAAIAMHTAAPQPAQAGASGGGEKPVLWQYRMAGGSDEWRNCEGGINPDYSRELWEVRALYDRAIPASPATGMTDCRVPHSKYDPCHNCEPDDTPPAHGEGETLRAAAKRLRLGVEGPRIADELEAMAERLTTRPTPEAQEARDGVRYRLIRDAVTGANAAALKMLEGDAPSSAEEMDARVDAALALPAQGEGRDE